MTQVFSYLNQAPLAGLMLTVTLGFSLGRVSWRGLSLGPAGGTLLVAILLGAYGLSFRELYGSEDPRITVGLLGFCLFIYSVGFEAGPRFFSSLRGGSGWRFAAVGALVNLFALLLAVACGKLFGLSEAITAGMLSGALTSAPTYAAATEVVEDAAPLAVSFAITFPFGLVGIVMMVQFLPRLLREDLARGTALDEERPAPGSPELRRAFEVTRSGVQDRSLAELDLTHRTGCTIRLVHRGSQVLWPDAATKLRAGDRVLARGRLEQLQELERLVGQEVYDEELRRAMPSPRAVHVRSRQVVDRPLRDLEFFRAHRCMVTSVLRSGVALDATADLRLMREDVVMVSGRRDDVRAVARLLGRFERSTHETDIAIYAGGILLGLLVGNLRWHGLGVDFRLGAATGLLLTGVLLGRFRQIGPFSAHVPLAARQLVRDLGILLFIAETGVRAGGSSLEGIRGFIWLTVGAGALVTVLPVLAALFLGRRLFRLGAVDRWGSVCGGMTSSSALVAIRAAADSDEPAISYAAAYAVASILATLAGQVVVLLM